MKAIVTSLQGLTIGAPIQFQALTVFPLFGPGSPEPDYITLDEALEQQSLAVTEVSEGGSVPELRVLNSGTRRVLLLDGEELLGAKQNRIINVSILVPVGKTLIIPVSCVERGRWHSSSARFSSSSRTYYARGRAMHTSQVSDSMRSSGSRRSDQASVWHDIETKSSRLRSVSATSAMAAMFEQYHAQIEEYVHAFQPQNDGIGALFCIQGRMCGLEFFDSPATQRKVMPKILRGYALDALDTSMEAVPGVLGDPTWSEHAAQEFLEEILAAEMSAYPAIGDGEEVRLASTSVAGAALLDEGRVVHFCAFRKMEGMGHDHGPQ